MSSKRKPLTSSPASLPRNPHKKAKPDSDDESDGDYTPLLLLEAEEAKAKKHREALEKLSEDKSKSAMKKQQPTLGRGERWENWQREQLELEIKIVGLNYKKLSKALRKNHGIAKDFEQVRWKCQTPKVAKWIVDNADVIPGFTAAAKDALRRHYAAAESIEGDNALNKELDRLGGSEMADERTFSFISVIVHFPVRVPIPSSTHPQSLPFPSLPFPILFLFYFIYFISFLIVISPIYI